MKNVVVIGNGVSGITAARHIRKQSDCRIVVVSEETEYFFSRTALMYVFMGHMPFEQTKPYEDWFWEKNKIELVFDRVTDVATDNNTLTLAKGDTLSYDELIIATGSKPRLEQWPGIDKKGVQGLYSFQDLKKLEENVTGVSEAVIVGGGLIGVELAEMLKSRGFSVTVLVREKSYWQSVLPQVDGVFVGQEIERHGITLRYETEVEEILGDDQVNGVRTTSGEVISCQLLGVTIGVEPNIAFLKPTMIACDRGVLVDPYLKTNIDNVYAIGDCAQFKEAVPGRRPIEQVWYTGKFMGQVVADNICGKPKSYAPGNWFNSAKFFDIEYQTYGRVNTTLSGSESCFYWSANKVSIYIQYNEEVFLGVNVFGWRLRHEVVDRWLNEKRDVLYVLAHLKDACFDPEFYTRHENEVVKAFNEDKGTQVVVKKKSWRRILGR